MESSAKRGYHHGDLRAALIEAGLKLIEERTADEVGLREAARAVGVSATAVYRHFPDKAALLGALAAEGLARLGAAQRKAAAAAGGGAAGFRATGRAYVRFALKNPGLFRLIFSQAPKYDPRDWSGKSDDAMRFLQENAEQLAAKRGAEGAKLFALRAWALVHGLAVLLLDRQIELDMATIEAIIDAPDFEKRGASG
ncbi:MAG TPA: TetR/AcrR family transcriptional regulator [Caulobacterales bacterium]|nr:TetR/AcrR family transcriptional regulator [Caulobacterales bacterium]